MTDLADELAALARRLSAAQIRTWRDILGRAMSPDETVVAALIDAQTGSRATGAAEQLVSAWRKCSPELPGAAIALALGAGAVMQERAERHRPRLVVSGPTSAAVPVRLTSSVAVEVIRSARERVLLVSFAAYGVAEVVMELAEAAARGVSVDLVLESSIEQGGMLRGAGAGPFDALADRATFWHWPARNRRNGGRASLHAKIVLADAETVLLSSANFTDRGLSDNIEVGFLVRDRDTSGPLDAHFRHLMRPEAHCLQRLPR